MPKVGKMKFPYTAAGKKKAKAVAKKKGMKVVKQSKKKGTRGKPDAPRRQGEHVGNPMR